MSATQYPSNHSLCRKLAAWLRLGKMIWLSMLLGYLWVLFSGLICFEFPASGAILGSSALVSELLFSRLKWRQEVLNYERHTRVTWAWHDEIKQNTYQASHHFFHSRQVSALSFRHIQTPKGEAPALNMFDELRITAQPSDIHENNHGESSWLIRKTADAFDRITAIAIAFTAIIGAVIWGYGHLLFC